MNDKVQPVASLFPNSPDTDEASVGNAGSRVGSRGCMTRRKKLAAK